MTDQPKHAPPPGTRAVKGRDEPAGPGSYQAFLDELRWPQMAPKTEPRASAEAVLCTLVRRLSGGEAEDLMEELPTGFQQLLRRCDKHEGSPAERIDKATFITDVGDHLGVDKQEAERVVRAVFSGVRDRLSEEEVEDVASQLPADLADLWRRPT